MIIFKGLGILGLIIPVLCLMLVQYVIDTFFGTGFYTEHEACKIAALLISAGAVYVIGTALNKNAVKDVIDVKTGTLIRIKDDHTLFFIPLQYVSLLILLFAALAATS